MTAALTLPLILQAIGIAVLLAEVVLPSGGVLTLAAVALFGYSVYTVFTGVSVTAGMAFVAADIVILPVVLIAGLKLLAYSPVTLRKSLKKTEGVSSQSEKLAGYTGQSGKALNNLRPSGTALIGGRRVDVVSRGEFIEKDKPVLVIAVEGNRVVVREEQEQE
ncbi:MAG TPA: NfeD family protein [Desulfosalsimonadaceae bacterium]|nr:NfeD family protein [Desulfosalsimonadaceae bacterium]